SEERRVGKECRSRWSACQEREKDQRNYPRRSFLAVIHVPEIKLQMLINTSYHPNRTHTPKTQKIEISVPQNRFKRNICLFLFRRLQIRRLLPEKQRKRKRFFFFKQKTAYEVFT